MMIPRSSSVVQKSASGSFSPLGKFKGLLTASANWALMMNVPMELTVRKDLRGILVSGGGGGEEEQGGGGEVSGRWEGGEMSSSPDDSRTFEHLL